MPLLLCNGLSTFASKGEKITNAYLILSITYYRFRFLTLFIPCSLAALNKWHIWELKYILTTLSISRCCFENITPLPYIYTLSSAFALSKKQQQMLNFVSIKCQKVPTNINRLGYYFQPSIVYPSGYSFVTKLASFRHFLHILKRLWI